MCIPGWQPPSPALTLLLGLSSRLGNTTSWRKKHGIRGFRIGDVAQNTSTLHMSFSRYPQDTAHLSWFEVIQVAHSHRDHPDQVTWKLWPPWEAWRHQVWVLPLDEKCHLLLQFQGSTVWGETAKVRGDCLVHPALVPEQETGLSWYSKLCGSCHTSLCTSWESHYPKLFCIKQL